MPSIDDLNLNEMLSFLDAEIKKLDKQIKDPAPEVTVPIDMNEINKNLRDLEKKGYFVTAISEACDKELSALIVRCAPDDMTRAYINLCAPFCVREEVMGHFLSDIYDSLYSHMTDMLADKGMDVDDEDCGYILELFAKMLRFEGPETWESELEELGFGGLSDPRVAMLYNWLHGVRVSGLRRIPVKEGDPDDHYFLLRSDYNAGEHGDSSRRTSAVLMSTLLAPSQKTIDLWHDKIDLNEEDAEAASEALLHVLIGNRENDAIGFIVPLYTGDTELLTERLAQSEYKSLFDQKLHEDMATVLRRFSAQVRILESADLQKEKTPFDILLACLGDKSDGKEAPFLDLLRMMGEDK